MYLKYILMLLTTAATTTGQPTKCDQTPRHATATEQSENKGLFLLKIANSDKGDESRMFTPLQTYALTLETTNETRPFRWFMITVEDPEVDNNIYDFGHKDVDVGSLKTLDSSDSLKSTVKSRYSERCANSVESYDNTEKLKVEIHWASPENTERVRIRAMVAENSETWYTGENLTLVLEKNTNPPPDTPPYPPSITCNECSEARYEVIFKGQWSRLLHPLHYPSKPDENGYSHMVGASHDYNFTLWAPDTLASPGMKELAENAEIGVIEREIINSMAEQSGTRTLIRGRRRHHPHMHEPSHALFRVDRFHHLFSIAVAMKPSPDWFLGTKKFELCTNDGWLPYYELPLYPWDAGTVDGVSYESPKSMTNPVSSIERVKVGSFDAQSPFFQTNLNDLKPFAMVEVRRLDVYPLDPSECTQEDDNQAEEEPSQDEAQNSPRIAESRQNLRCSLGEWGDWSPCIPDVGSCGIGAKSRSRQKNFPYRSGNDDDIQVLSDDYGSCQGDSNQMEYQHCFVEC